MKIGVRQEQNGLIYIDKNLIDGIDYTQPPYSFTIIDVDKEDCEPVDFNMDLSFSLAKYNARKQKEIDDVKLMELTNWFKNDYTTYEQMFTRREKLGISDVIEDEFRNRVGENAYHNLIELYEEAEVVAKEIRELRK